jgi:hypothetical protein
VNGTDLKFRDLKVFLTNRPEDKQIFNEIRGLSQAVLQNGGSLYDIIELYSTNSVRQMKKVFKTLKERQEQLQDQEMQQKQQALEQQQQQAQAALEQAQQLQAEKIAHDDYQNELDRINKKEVALINALGRNENAAADVDQSGVADALEVSRLTNDQANAARDYDAKMQELASKRQSEAQKLQLEREKLQVERDNQKNDLEIAKVNARNRGAQAKKK